MTNNRREIWVFGDYRNYFQNRVTLQLIAKGKELAAQTGADLCAVVFGNDIDEWVWEYTCHGADRIYIVKDESLAQYKIEIYAALLERLAREYEPDILLIGATAFGKEFAPRVAKRLGAGLSADCIGLKIDKEERLVATAPAFGGNLLADIVAPDSKPQMATVRPGTFKEIPHNDNLDSEKIYIPLPDDLPEERVRLISSEKIPERGVKLENARVVVCGGRGMGSKRKFRNLNELAKLLGAEVGATRPVVYSNWASHDALVGQAGKNIRPQALFSFGISGAIQHTAAITDADFIIAVNKNPNATMMKMADVAIVADAGQVCNALIKELKKRAKD